jgi:hypothetical protein
MSAHLSIVHLVFIQRHVFKNILLIESQLFVKKGFLRGDEDLSPSQGIDGLDEASKDFHSRIIPKSPGKGRDGNFAVLAVPP